MMKHRGVYWRKQSEKFVVSFKSNCKAKTYGLFASFDDAVKRAEEVWPTLPIANRSQRICDKCCVLMSNQLFDWGKSTCKACRKTEKRSQQTPKRNCKTCGCDFVSKDKRQVVCSKECGHKGRVKGKVTCFCSVCGKQAERYAQQLARYKFVACSVACQKVIAGRAGKDVVKASMRAKKRWCKKRSAERRAANHWVKLCDSQLAQLNQVLQAGQVWERRCHAAIVSLRKRTKPECGKSSRVIETWEDAIQKAYSEKRSCPQSIWGKKCSSIVLNLKRRQRKQHQQN